MQSPFKIFRKHQKVAMAILFIMCMIGFGVGDTILKMFGSGSRGPTEGKVVVETNVGNLSQRELNNLRGERRTVERFIVEAFIRANPQYARFPGVGDYVVRSFGFGGISQEAILNTWLYRHEARQLGIVVSNRQVEEYIDTVTRGGELHGNRLSTKQFQDVLKSMKLSPKLLFEMLRAELQAGAAFQMKFPRLIPSPERYWEYYQQLNTRQKIAVAGLPVREFTDKVPDPSDSQVAAFFDQHKSDFESAVNGEFKPGFKQPQKVKLHYLELSYAAVERKVRDSGSITDKEIEDYYAEKKFIDKRLQDSSGPLSDDSSPIDPDFVPEGQKPGTDAGPDLDAKPVDKTDENPTSPETDQPKSSDGAPDKKPAEPKSEQGSDCLPTGADETEKQAEPAGSQSDKQKKGEGEEQEKSPAQDDPAEKEPPQKDPADKKPSDDPIDDDMDEAPALPRIGGKKPAPPARPLKFKPLDDDLKNVIRESIIQDRVGKLMQDEIARAQEAMQRVGEKFAVSEDLNHLSDPTPKQLDELEHRSETELRKVGESVGMKFGQTGLVSASELNELPGIGKAYEPGSMDPRRGSVTTIVEQAFANEALCQVFESELLASDKFLCWKIRDIARHVPKLADPGIREQVVAAWKRRESLPLAKKRAEELAARARTSDKDFGAALAGETVTGTPKGLAVTTYESPEFSFYRASFANPGMFSREAPVELGDPIVVNGAGRGFMKTIFEDLAEGDIGAAINNDASVYYVVKVVTRRPADRDAFKDAQILVNNSPYMQLAQLDQRSVAIENNERMNKKYAVKWHDLPAREVGPMYDDE
jgi:hypothetical protein